jgi:hypothetical protein
MSRKCEPGCDCSRHKKRSWTDEQRAGARAAQKCEPGCTCARHKRVMTPEHKAKIAAANAARKGIAIGGCPEGCTCAKHQAYYRGGSAKGRTFSDEAKANIAAGAQAREYSPEETQRRSDQAKAQHADPEWEAARIIALQAAKKPCPEGCACGNHSEQKRRLISEARTGSVMSTETKAKISATLKRMLLEGTWEPGKTQPALYVGDDVIVMRSSWEVDFAEEMDRHGVRWQYEPERFDLGWTTYMPDFYLPDRQLYIEVKGYLREKAVLKMVDFQLLGHELVLVTYHPSERGLSEPAPPQVRLVLAGQIAAFVGELSTV